MKLKHFLAAAAALFFAGALWAQTPEEIVEKMSAQMDRGDMEGMVMDLNMKMPIIGTVSSHNVTLGEKLKTIVSAHGKAITSWMDETTEWEYNPEKGEITISARKKERNDEKESSDVDAFKGVSDGYDLSIQKETPQAWYILAKKSKTNKEKDDPKKIEMAISKATFLPIYLKTKQSMITISIENVSIGVSEKDVTFNPADYPNATIIDKR